MSRHRITSQQGHPVQMIRAIDDVDDCDECDNFGRVVHHHTVGDALLGR